MELSQEEFATLKNAVYDSSIVGKDIFCRTTPKELAKFKEFTANMPRYDVVIDGLNVAYAIGTQQSPLVFSLLVRNLAFSTTGMFKRAFHHVRRRTLDCGDAMLHMTHG